MSYVIVKRTLDVMASAAMIIASCAATWWLWSDAAPPQPLASPVKRTSPIEDISDRRLSVRLDALDGTYLPGSKMAIVEFSDFECPFCQRHATGTLPLIMSEFVEQGSVSYLMGHFPLERIHKNAMFAAVQAKCAARQGQFWAMHAALFKEPTLVIATAPKPALGGLALEPSRFQKCLESAETEIRADMELIRQLGVNSTPTFFVGFVSSDRTIALKRRINGALPIDSFRSLIKGVLALAP